MNGLFGGDDSEQDASDEDDIVDRIFGVMKVIFFSFCVSLPSVNFELFRRKIVKHCVPIIPIVKSTHGKN